MNDTSKKGRLRNDFILIGSLVFAALIFLGIFLLKSEGGDWAVVTLDGREIVRYSLSEDGEYPIISGENSEHSNQLVIKDGKASVTEANCPDGICVSHRAISRTGETIVCLPHKLVIHIETDKESELDMVS